MTDDDALLQAIIDNPDDDSVRLVFADWLEDHGQTERAEFVRLQCEMAHLAVEDPRWNDRDVKVRKLQSRHQRQWGGRVLDLLGTRVSGWKFRRGFLSELTLEARGLELHAEKLFRLAPLEHLTVYHVGLRMPQFVALPQLSRLTGLSLHGNQLGHEGVSVLASCRFLTQLKNLVLSWNDIGNQGVVALTGCPHFSRLTCLDLHMNNIGDMGALALARSVNLPRLTSLALVHNPIRKRGRKALLDRFGGGVWLSEK